VIREYTIIIHAPIDPVMVHSYTQILLSQFGMDSHIATINLRRYLLHILRQDCTFGGSHSGTDFCTSVNDESRHPTCLFVGTSGDLNVVGVYQDHDEEKPCVNRVLL